MSKYKKGWHKENIIGIKANAYSDCGKRIVSGQKVLGYSRLTPLQEHEVRALESRLRDFQADIPRSRVRFVLPGRHVVLERRLRDLGVYFPEFCFSYPTSPSCVTR